jgi:fatty acid-binding protein DegV
VLVNVIPSDIIFMREGNIILKVNKSEDNESSSEEEKAKTKRITKKSHSRVAIKREATESEMIR